MLVIATAMRDVHGYLMRNCRIKTHPIYRRSIFFVGQYFVLEELWEKNLGILIDHEGHDCGREYP